jgi:hypothetical protein
LMHGLNMNQSAVIISEKLHFSTNITNYNKLSV